MYTKIVTVGTADADLKTLLETAGHVFPGDNDSCSGILIQIDPTLAEAEYVSVHSVGQTTGIRLRNGEGPHAMSFAEFRIRNVHLKASTAGVTVNVMIETAGA